jgi:hypothetical protein
MIQIRKLAIVLGLLLIAPRAEASVLEFDFSGTSVDDNYGSTTGYTATASFTLNSSAFTNPYYSQVDSIGITEVAILSSALTSFSASLTTPLGDRQFGLSDVDTSCSGLPATPCFDVFFDILASGQIIFEGSQDGFTSPGNPSGFVVLEPPGLVLHDGAVRTDYSGTWTQNTSVGAPLSDIGTGLPAMLFVGGPMLWRWRRRWPISRVPSNWGWCLSAAVFWLATRSFVNDLGLQGEPPPR